MVGQCNDDCDGNDEIDDCGEDADEDDGDDVVVDDDDEDDEDENGDGEGGDDDGGDADDGDGDGDCDEMMIAYGHDAIIAVRVRMSMLI